MKVRFIPQDVEHEIGSDQTILELAQEHGIFIRSVCKGQATCGECRVKIHKGEHNIMPPAQKELDMIGSAYFVDHRRLSCQMRCYGDVDIDVSEHAGKTATVKKIKSFKGLKGVESESRVAEGTLVLEDDDAKATNSDSDEK